ncbi:MAG: alpha/beta hydrolase [Spirochaetota bacterium]
MSLAVALLALALGSCATVGSYTRMVSVHNAGVRFRGTYEHLAADIVYSERSDVALDVYSPADGAAHPVFVFVHGGGWNSNTKELFAPIAMRLVPRDVVVVIPAYTLYPEATYTGMAREIADAVSWVFESIHDYGGDPARVFLGGHSAGAHLSGLVAYDERWLRERGHSRRALAGWIGLSGVYDGTAHVAWRAERGLETPTMTAVMEGAPNLDRASPLTYASNPGGPPAWIVHGERDEIVTIEQSRSMHDALRAAGTRSELVIYPESDHGDYLSSDLAREQPRLITDIVRIVRGR